MIACSVTCFSVIKNTPRVIFHAVVYAMGFSTEHICSLSACPLFFVIEAEIVCQILALCRDLAQVNQR